MENKIINIAIVAEVAEALKDLRNQMVFVGGAVVSLNSDERVKTFLRSEFKKIMDSPFSDEIVSSHIHPLIREERIPIIEDKIFKILD